MSGATTTRPSGRRPVEQREPIFKDSNVARLVREGVPKPKLLIPGLVYDERPSLMGMVGHPDAGKTVIVLYLALEAMRGGRHVIWLDYEMGEIEPALRL